MAHLTHHRQHKLRMRRAPRPTPTIHPYTWIEIGGRRVQFKGVRFEFSEGEAAPSSPVAGCAGTYRFELKLHATGFDKLRASVFKLNNAIERISVILRQKRNAPVV